MARWAVYACENIYGGLHGMNYTAVVDFESSTTVENFARGQSLEVIESYSDIVETLEQDVEYNIEPGMSDEEIEQLRYETYLEDTEYTWEKVDEAKAGEYSTQELDEMIYDLGYEEFVELYC